MPELVHQLSKARSLGERDQPSRPPGRTHIDRTLIALALQAPLQRIVEIFNYLRLREVASVSWERLHSKTRELTAEQNTPASRLQADLCHQRSS